MDEGVMIVDCHTHIWQSPEQLGDGALAELSRPTVVAGQRMRLLPQADTANHLLASEPADRTIVLGFKSQHLGAAIPNEYIADYCREHAERMVGYARAYLLDEVARAFPNLKMVVSHLGYPWVDEAIVLLGKHQNVYADVAALLRRPWVAYDALVRAHQFHVIEKLLFGSDFPFT